MNRYEAELKEKELGEQIAKILADQQGLSWDHRGSRDSCLHDAYGIIAAWMKNLREPQTEIERLCQSVVEIRQTFATALADRQAQWAAMREAKKLEPEPEPFTSLTLRDEATGRRVRVTFPTDSIQFF